MLYFKSSCPALPSEAAPAAGSLVELLPLGSVGCLLCYHVNLHFNFNFQENFNEVHATSVNKSLWFHPMDYGEVAQRLLGLKENTGQDQLPPAIINSYNEIVEFASNKFADLQRNLIYNDHHFEVLKSLRQPVFVSFLPSIYSLETPKACGA